MSRLALLVGAVPQRCSEGPIVRLLPGHWILRIEGLLDSVLTLNTEYFGSKPIHDGALFDIFEPADFQIKFAQRGTENFINVFAEKQ